MRAISRVSSIYTNRWVGYSLLIDGGEIKYKKSKKYNIGSCILLMT